MAGQRLIRSCLSFCTYLSHALVALALLFTISTAQAASSAWNVNADGSWSTAGSWASGIPGSTSADNTDIATFGLTLTAARTVTVDATRYIGGISFTNTGAFAYTLSGGQLYLNSGGVIQTTALVVSTNTISTPIQIDGASGGTATFTAGATGAGGILNIGAVTGNASAGNTTTLTLNGANTGTNLITGVIGDGSGGGVLAIIKSGAGIWALRGNNSFSGRLVVNSGTLILSGANTINNGITLNAGALVLTNNSNTIGGGIVVNSGTLFASASAGGNPFGFTNNLTIGTTNGVWGPGGIVNFVGIGTSTITTNGNLIAAGTYAGGTLSIYAGGGLAPYTTLQFSNLVRTGRATLVLNTSGTAFTAPGSYGITNRITFVGNGTNLVNSLLPVWMQTSMGDFLTYGANGVTQAIYAATFNSGMTTQVVSTASTKLTAAQQVYALKLSSSGVDLNGQTLTIGDGTSAGLAYYTGSITSGVAGASVAFGTAEAIVDVANITSGTISVNTSGTGGLTKMGSGTLTLAQFTSMYIGDTLIQAGGLNLTPIGAITYTNSFNGAGGLSVISTAAFFSISGASTGTIGLLSVGGGGGALTLSNGVVFNSGNVTIGNSAGVNSNAYNVGGLGALTTSSNTLFYVGYLGSGYNTMTITNALLLSAGASAVGYNTSNNTLTVLAGGTLVLSNNNTTPVIGYNSAGTTPAVSNSMVVNGGTLVSWGASSFVISRGGGYGNSLTFSNGAQVFSGALTVGFGSGDVSNTLYIGGLGLSSFVTNRAAVNVGGGTGASFNQAIITNATLQAASMAIGYGAGSSFNTVTVMTNGCLIAGGINFNPYQPAGNFTGNTLVVNGGVVTNTGTMYMKGYATGFSVGNGIVISNGGTYIDIGNFLNIGMTPGDSSNFVQIGGLGAASYASNGLVNVGSIGSGGNYLIVTNATFLNTSCINLGVGSSNNSVRVQAGGTLTELYGGTSSLIVGGGASSSNVVWVQSGGVLNLIGTGLAVSNGFGNAITNSGGVYQFSFTNANASLLSIVNSNGFGAISLNSGTISYSAVTNANIFGNWGGANGNSLTNIAFSGANTFQLNAASNQLETISQTYTFGSGLGATNYAGLAMINGQTAYRNGDITISNTGTLFISNTVASITGLFTNRGLVTIANGAATFGSGFYNAAGTGTLNNATVNGLTNASGATVLLAAGSTGVFSRVVYNQGTVDATNGILWLQGGLTNASGATFNVQLGGTAIFSNRTAGLATFTNSSGATVNLNGGTMIDHEFVNQGVANLSGGLISNALQNSGWLNVVSGITTAAPDLWNLSGGVVSNLSGARLQVGSTGAGPVINSNVFVMAGGTLIAGSVTNAAGASFQLATGQSGTVTSQLTGAMFVNNGSLSLASGQTLSFIGMSLTNSAAGYVVGNGGTLVFNNASFFNDGNTANANWNLTTSTLVFTNGTDYFTVGATNKGSAVLTNPQFLQNNYYVANLIVAAGTTLNLTNFVATGVCL